MSRRDVPYLGPGVSPKHPLRWLGIHLNIGEADRIVRLIDRIAWLEPEEARPIMALRRRLVAAMEALEREAHPLPRRFPR